MSSVVVLLFKISMLLNRWGVPVVPVMITLVIRVIFGGWLPAGCRVGKGLVLGYGALGVVVHHRCIIGDGCHISHNVTLGGTSKKEGVPMLGDNVYVGAGAIVLGPVRVGSNSVIAANAVVISDVPNNTLVAGVPAKVVKRNVSSHDYI